MRPVGKQPLASVGVYAACSAVKTGALHLSLYTMLQLPILYAVWHAKAGSWGGRALRNSRAKVVQ